MMQPGSVEAPIPPAGGDSVEEALSVAEGYGDQAQALLSKVKQVLQRIYLKVCPLNKQRDTSIGQLVRFFLAGKDPLISYEWDQKKEGSDLTLKLTLEHGVDGKALISATKEFPRMYQVRQCPYPTLMPSPSPCLLAQ